MHIKEYIYKEINIMRNYLVKRNNEGNDLDFLDDAFNSFFKPMFYEEKFNTMKTDIKETETGYVMDIEVPGFDKKDVNISLKDGYLTITAEKKESEEDKKHNYLRKERSTSLSRSYYVGDVAKESVKAKYDNGVLTIEIPKEEPKKELTHNIEIE
mgnify:FL=1